GVVFSRGEPGAGIVGASGLLLGLGRLYDMEAVCLMGETSGYFVDPKSAQAVLDVLTKYLSIEISFNELENKAKQIDQITSKLKDIEAAPETPDKREDLGYIGRSEEHTSELQSLAYLVCRLLLEKKKQT